MCWNQREVNNIADVDCLVKKYELQLYGKPTIFTEDSVKIFGMISDLCWEANNFTCIRIGRYLYRELRSQQFLPSTR